MHGLARYNVLLLLLTTTDDLQWVALGSAAPSEYAVTTSLLVSCGSVAVAAGALGQTGLRPGGVDCCR